MSHNLNNDFILKYEYSLTHVTNVFTRGRTNFHHQYLQSSSLNMILEFSIMSQFLLIAIFVLCSTNRMWEDFDLVLVATV